MSTISARPRTAVILAPFVVLLPSLPPTLVERACNLIPGVLSPIVRTKESLSLSVRTTEKWRRDERPERAGRAIPPAWIAHHPPAPAHLPGAGGGDDAPHGGERLRHGAARHAHDLPEDGLRHAERPGGARGDPAVRPGRGCTALRSKHGAAPPPDLRGLRQGGGRSRRLQPDRG